MARARTLLQLRTRIRELADCMPDSNARHPTSVLNTWINESWQALRAMVTDKGDLLYVKNVSTSTGVGPDTGKAYGLLALPAAAVRIHAIDIAVGSDIRSLTPVSFNERNEFQRNGVLTDVPVNFAVFNVGEESGASVGNGWIALLPAPDAVYNVTIYYLPAWTDITNDAHVFDGFEGWDDWVAYDVVMKCAMKDNDMAATAQIAAQMKAEAQARVLASCNSIQRVAPSYGRDTARQMRAQRRRETW
jgi:hypothetical protein